jgi:signal transduction histidine kinase
LWGIKVRCTFAQIGVGGFFGEMAALDEKPRSANAVAASDTTLLFIPRAAMLELLARSPALSLGLLSEVSERLRLFDQQYTREFLQNERLAIVGWFARSVVHDLNNPFTITRLATDAACAEGATPESRQLAQARIRRQIDRITELVNDIMEFTQSQRVASEFVPTDYRAFVSQTLAEIRLEAEMKSATLELEDEPPAVKLAINAKRLHRVFFNLIHNAIDAMPDGGEIILRFVPVNAEIIMEIEDVGPGIPPGMENRLFWPFASHGKAHGTGLGLSICKRIVEDHRGRIWVRNEPERGAVFSFALPFPKGG